MAAARQVPGTGAGCLLYVRPRSGDCADVYACGCGTAATTAATTTAADFVHVPVLHGERRVLRCPVLPGWHMRAAAAGLRGWRNAKLGWQLPEQHNDNGMRSSHGE